jgi:hypothetical protein
MTVVAVLVGTAAMAMEFALFLPMWLRRRAKCIAMFIFIYSHSY